MLKKDYDKEYNNSAEGSVRTTRQYHKRNYGELNPLIDTFDGKNKERMYEAQNGECACCHKKLTMKQMQIDHISPASRFNSNFLQGLCSKCNLMKKSLVISFAFLEMNYSKTFFQLFIEFRDWTIENFQMDDAAVRRVEKRIKELEVSYGK